MDTASPDTAGTMEGGDRNAERTGEGKRTASERSDSERAVLVPVLSAATDQFTVDTASAVAAGRNAELVLSSTDVDIGSSSLALIRGGTERTSRREALADRARATVDVPVSELHYPRTRPSRLVEETAARRSIDTVVVERPASAGPSGVPTSVVERIDGTTDCDVAVVSGRPPMGTVSSVLLAVGGGPHSWSAAGVARDVAAAEGAWVDVLHVVPPEAGRWERTRGRRIIGTAMDRLSDDADEWLYEANDLGDVLVEQSAYYDLVVMGAPRKSRLQQFVSGSTARAVHRDAGTAVITVRRGERRRSLLSQFVG